MAIRLRKMMIFPSPNLPGSKGWVMHVSILPLTRIESDLVFIELDDGNILTGKPNQFDGKNPWVSYKFSLKPIQ